jgi:DNA-binding NarL/FixJ family response regulator
VPEPIRFCAVDDHDIVILGVQAMADYEDDLEFCGGAADADQARDLIRRARPEVILLDLRLGSSNSFELCRDLLTLEPTTSIVMFTAFGNEELLDQAIHAGAVGYVLKDTSTSGLPEVLRTIRRDGTFFDPRVAGRALLSRRSGGPAHAPLSDRELRIVRMIAKGADNWAIAEELQLSVHMIKFHIGALLKRYGVKRRAELVRVLMERQLL